MNVLSNIAHGAANLRISAEAGLIGTVTTLNTDLQAFIRNAAVTVLLAAFLIICWKKGWAMGAIIGGLFIAGFGYFAVNGGFELIGGLFTQTIQS